MQTLVKLMLRLTTKVTVSPGQLGPQLIGGDPHLLDHLGPGLGEQRRQLVLGELDPLAPLGDRPLGDPGLEALFADPPRPSPRDEAPVLQLDHVEDPLLHPLGVHVLGVDAEPLGQREPPGRQLLAHLMRDSGTAPRARCDPRWPTAHPDPSPRPRPAPATNRSRFGGTCTPTSGINRLHSAISRLISSIPTGLAQLGSASSPPESPPPLAGDGDDPERTSTAFVREGSSPSPFHRAREASISDVRHLGPVVAGMGDEVLQDDLLDVAVAGVGGGERFQGFDPRLLGLADADEDSRW